MFNGTYEAVVKIVTLFVVVARSSSLPTTRVNVSSMLPSMTSDDIKVSSEVRSNVGALVEAPVEVVGPRSVETETRIKIQKKRESEHVGGVSVRDTKGRSSYSTKAVKDRKIENKEADDTDSTNHSRYREEDDNGAEYDDDDDNDEERRQGLRSGAGSDEVEDVERKRKSGLEGSSNVHLDNDGDEDVRDHSKREGRQPKIWDQWGKWSCCSVSCGTGKLTRWRHCVAGGCASGEKEAQLKSCELINC